MLLVSLELSLLLLIILCLFSQALCDGYYILWYNKLGLIFIKHIYIYIYSVSVNSKKHPICLLRGYLLYYALKCNLYPAC